MTTPPAPYDRLATALEARRAERSPSLDDLARTCAGLADRLGLRIGATTMSEVPGAFGGYLLAKWESENQFGSVKDRVALALVASVLETGQVGDGRGFVEYTGGSLGVSLAAIAQALSIPATLVMSGATAPSIVQQCRDAGATVELVGRSRGFADVMLHALDVADATDQYLLFQHANPACREIHARWTGSELVGDLGNERCSALVAPIGTGGTLAGCATALRASGMPASAIGVTPSELPYASLEPPNAAPKLAGSGGLGHGIRQPFIAELGGTTSVDSVVSYPVALAAMNHFHEATGSWIGSSAAAAWLVASEHVREGASKERIIAIFPSSGTPEERQRAASLDAAPLPHRA